ncbi:hypothetical protein BJV77DRAFT_677247 [Russula vinacea]|nr:hypothetical protein BJV77DRAFT_677247 [Russula vinacea]
MSPMPVKAKVVHVQFPHRDDYKSRRKTMPVPGWWFEVEMENSWYEAVVSLHARPIASFLLSTGCWMCLILFLWSTHSAFLPCTMSLHSASMTLRRQPFFGQREL